MKNVDDPIITKYKGKPYTKITWKIDFKRFEIDGYSEDYGCFMKRSGLRYCWSYR